MCDILNISINDIYGIYPGSEFVFGYEEQELLKKFCLLDAAGKALVNTVTSREYERCIRTDYAIELPDGYITLTLDDGLDKEAQQRRLSFYASALNKMFSDNNSEE